MKVAGVFLVLIVCVFSCDRKEFNEYVGNYACRKLTFNWQNGEPNEYVLTENQSIEVVKKKKYLVLKDLQSTSILFNPIKITILSLIHSITPYVLTPTASFLAAIH